MQSFSIEVNNLTKIFQKNQKPAVLDLNFTIKAGESVAFLGPNGAGKSTTIKMLCGIISPSSGTARIQGNPAGSFSANKMLGLVFGTRSQLYLHMTVEQCLNLIAEIYFITGDTKKARIEKLCKAFQIESLLSRRVRTLSLGQRMRCEVIAALIHKPQVLLLDEPTIGLDIVAKNQLRELIIEWQTTEKTTLMLTSHDFTDIETLCSRCILIDQGVKRFDGELKALKGDLAWIRRVQVTTRTKTAPFDLSFSQDLNFIQLPLSNGSDFTHYYEVKTNHYPMADALSKISTHYGANLQDISIEEITLEEILRNLLIEKKK